MLTRLDAALKKIRKRARGSATYVIELRELIALCTWRKPRPSDVVIKVVLYIFVLSSTLRPHVGQT